MPPCAPPNASIAIVTHGCAAVPVPSGSRLTVFSATTPPVFTLMNSSVTSTAPVPMLAAHRTSFCPGSALAGKLASRNATGFMPAPALAAVASAKHVNHTQAFMKAPSCA